MRSRNALVVAVALLSALASLAFGASLRAVEAQTGPIYVFGMVGANVTTREKDGSEKHEFRVYFTKLMEVSRDDFNKYGMISNSDRGQGWNNLSDYFDATVAEGGKARGEEIASSYYEIKLFHNVGMTEKGYYTDPKEKIEKQRQELIDNWKNTGRKVAAFNWDPSGNNKEKDLEREKKGTPPPE